MRLRTGVNSRRRGSKTYLRNMRQPLEMSRPSVVMAHASANYVRERDNISSWTRVTHRDTAALPEAGTQADLDRAAGTEMGSAERIPEVVRPSIARDIQCGDAQLEIDPPASAELLDQ